MSRTQTSKLIKIILFLCLFKKAFLIGQVRRMVVKHESRKIREETVVTYLRRERRKLF